MLPENSIEGVKAAFASGAFAVEIDVRLTKDLDFVVVHDAVLQPDYYQVKTPIHVSQTMRDELVSISFGQSPPPNFPEQKALQVQIPALSAMVSFFSAPAHQFNIEVKVEEGEEELTAEAFEMWMDHEEYMPFRVQSFNLLFLDLLEENCPDVPKHWLIEKEKHLHATWPEWLEGVAIESSLISDEVVKRAQEMKMVLSAWTVNSTTEAERLIQSSVSEIISDNPAMLIQALNP